MAKGNGPWYVAVVIASVLAVYAIIAASVGIDFTSQLWQARNVVRYCFTMTARDVPPWGSGNGDGESAAYAPGYLEFHLNSGEIKWNIQTNFNISKSTGNGNLQDTPLYLALYGPGGASGGPVAIDGFAPTLNSALLNSGAIAIYDNSLLKTITSNPALYYFMYNGTNVRTGIAAARLEHVCKWA